MHSLKRIRMTENHDQLNPGDKVNLPEHLADELIASGKATLELGTSTTTVQEVGPAQNKAVEPNENKGAKAPVKK